MQNDSSNVQNRKRDLSFPRSVLFVIGAAAALLGYPLAHYASTEVMQGVVAGAVLSVVNALAGYAAIEFAWEKSYTLFIQIMLGGIGLRLFFMLGLLVLLIVVFHMHVISLVGSVLTFYAIYLLLEVLFIQRKMERKNRIAKT